MLSADIGAWPAWKAEHFGSPHVIIQLDLEEDGRAVPIAAYVCPFMTLEGTDTFPILVARDSLGFTPATCCESKGRNTCAESFHVGMLRDLGAFVE